MRKIALALAAVAALGMSVPVMSIPAEAKSKKVMVIKHKKHWDRGRHYGWQRGHHYGWYKNKHHRHGATVIVR